MSIIGANTSTRKIPSRTRSWPQPDAIFFLTATLDPVTLDVSVAGGGTITADLTVTEAAPSIAADRRRRLHALRPRTDVWRR